MTVIDWLLEDSHIMLGLSVKPVAEANNECEIQEEEVNRNVRETQECD